MESMLFGAGLGLSALVAGGIVAEKKGGLYNKKVRQDIRYFRILPHADTVLDADKIIRLAEQFAGYNRTKQERAKKGREWFRFFIHRNEAGIAFYMGFPEDRQTGVDKAFESTYPECERHPMAHEDVPLPQVKGGYGGRFILREDGERAGLPLRLFDAKRDEWGDVLSFMEPGTWIDLTFSPASLGQLKKIVRRTTQDIRPNGKYAGGWVSAASEFGKEVLQEFNPRNDGSRRVRPSIPKPTQVRDLDPDEQTRYKSVIQRFTGREKVFEVSLCIWSDHPYASSVVQALAARMESMMSYDNGIHLKRSKRCSISDIAPIPLSNQTMIWTADEMANLFHLPEGKHRIMAQIPHLERGQRTLKKDELSNGISIGNLQHPIQQGRSVAIPLEQFTKHFVLTGMTGSGKSSTAVMMIQSILDQWIKDPHNSPGFSYFDPARETVGTILSRLLKAEVEGAKIPWEKIHYVYLGPSDYPLGLNLLHHGPNESIDSAAKEVLGLLKFAYGGDTPRMDRLVENALLTLLEDRKQHTILGIVPVLTDEDFRNRILPNVHDPIVRQFWNREVQDAGIDPILNRLSPLMTNKTMRRMFGQKKWGLDIRKYMDEGHIFLWDLLNVSEQNIKLTGGHLIQQYHQIAKGRSPRSKPHILAVDEAHLVQIPIMKKIIAEDRKFGLCLGLITQYVGQFEPWLQDEITENVGTILTCTQGMKSAGVLSTITAGSFTKDYLQKLPERVVAVYTKTKKENRRSEITTFTVESDPPYIYRPDGQIANYDDEVEMKAALEWSISKGNELQKRDGTPVVEVDGEIQDYLEYGTSLQISDDNDDDTFYE
jgi:hypothetical protein